MAKINLQTSVLEPTYKKTSIGGNHSMIKTSTMNKSKNAVTRSTEVRVGKPGKEGPNG